MPARGLVASSEAKQRADAFHWPEIVTVLSDPHGAAMDERLVHGDVEALLDALERNVVPVSPSTLHAYLLVLVLGFKGLKIEQHAREVMAYVADLGRDFTKFKTDFDLVGKHLGNAQTKFSDADKRLSRFETKLERAAESELLEGHPDHDALPRESLQELPRALDAA